MASEIYIPIGELFSLHGEMKSTHIIKKDIYFLSELKSIGEKI